MSNHKALEQYTKLLSARGDTWRSRGYEIEASSEGYEISGDLDQFYLDAVSRDADAHLGLEFLRLQGSGTWKDLQEMAEDDGIDLVESQEIFLAGKTFERHIQIL